MTELQSLVILVLVGFLPSEVWRWLGLALGRGLDEESEIIQWVRGVATALIGAVVMRIIVVPPGTLAGVPLSVLMITLRVKKKGPSAASTLWASTRPKKVLR